ncbi:MAG: DMT family transporter [Rhodospirillales bacterium]|nr:DMT family transporter [Rhodospirillales bacterium]
MLISMSIVPIMDGFAKELSARYSIVEIVWARYFFHLLYLLPIVILRYGVSALLPRYPVLQIIRGGMLLISTILFFAAIAVMPIADALAIVFISPLLVTALSPVLLGEKVGVRRWVAVSVGFIGAMIIIRPGVSSIDTGTMLALGAGIVYAFYMIATRKLSGSAPPLVTLTFTALLGAVVMSVAVPYQWTTPNALDFSMMAGMGACAALGHFLLIKAFDHAPASVLAPFGYSEIVMATAIGFVVFGDFPDHWTWVGVAVIIASGIYISLRERHSANSVPTVQAQGPFPEAPGELLPEKMSENVDR